MKKYKLYRRFRRPMKARRLKRSWYHGNGVFSPIWKHQHYERHDYDPILKKWFHWQGPFPYRAKYDTYNLKVNQQAREKRHKILIGKWVNFRYGKINNKKRYGNTTYFLWNDELKGRYVDYKNKQNYKPM